MLVQAVLFSKNMVNISVREIPRYEISNKISHGAPSDLILKLKHTILRVQLTFLIGRSKYVPIYISIKWRNIEIYFNILY